MTLEEAIVYAEQVAQWLRELKEVYAMIDGCKDTDELFVGYIRNRMKGAKG